MKRINAVFGAATLVLSACNDGAQPKNFIGPTASVEAEGGTQVVTGVIGPGALYTLYRPSPWNGRLVLYAHGYVNPAVAVRFPPSAVALRDALVARGYGFAYSSYSENGYAVKQGVQDTRQLRGLFASKFGEPEHTYVTGNSMGGAVTLMLAETNPGLFDGADYFFPGVIPGDVRNVPDDLKLNFNRDVAPAVRSALLADPPRTMEMAGVDQIEIRYASLEEVVSAIISALNLQVVGAEELADRVHGRSPFDNTATVYTGSQDDAALNAGVGRFRSTPDAANYFEHYYEPTGRLRIPVLTLHTTRDAIVPFAHEPVYAGIVAAQGTGDRLVQRSFDRFGHCTFTVPEQVAALEELVAWAETGVKPVP